VSVRIKVAGCYVYPLKSGGARQVEKLKITSRGPESDRVWMLVRDSGLNAGRFVTQRDRGCGKLALVQATDQGDSQIEFKLPNGESIVVCDENLPRYDGNVEVWGDKLSVLDGGDEAALWFSNYMQQRCRLVKISDDFIRCSDPLYSNPGDQVSLADGFPLHVTNVESLVAIQKFIPQGVTIGMERFRPNIVLDGLPAFKEDVVHEVKISDVVLEFVKPCIRCKITTVDQVRGISISNEPLTSLVKARYGEGLGLNGVFFGQNAIPRILGEIGIGDDVEIISEKPMHPAVERTKVNYWSY